MSTFPKLSVRCRLVADYLAFGAGPGLARRSTSVITIVAGPEEYLFGEEKAMLEVIEGKAPTPRMFQPYELGLFAARPQMAARASGSRPAARTAGSLGVGWEAKANPTPVNNAETLADVAPILVNRAECHRP